MIKQLILKYKSFHLPFHIVMLRVINKLIENINRSKAIKAVKGKTYLQIDSIPNLKSGPFYNLEIDVSELKDKEILYLNTQYLNHNFDYLGSGWVNLNINKELKSNDYSKIDWQRDFRNGFSFNANETFLELKIPKGADVKVPWELSRLQFLPRLAIFSIAKKELQLQNLLEFKNILYDFADSNPLGYGINWVSPMDVAIRIANIGLTYDIFLAQEKSLNDDKRLKATISKLIYEGAKFIFNNLEIKQGRTGNHYIFNLTGLLAACNYLVENKEIEAWYHFAKAELNKELKKQFYKDGFNAEASSAYHFFTSEAVFVATSYLKPNDQNAFFKENKNLINSIIQASLKITKPNGTIPQIGDNDSGKLFWLTPQGEFKSTQNLKENYLQLINWETEKGEEFDENHLNQSNYFGMIDGLSGISMFTNNISKLEKSLFSKTTEFSKNATSHQFFNKSFKGLIFSEKTVFKFSDYTKTEINTNSNWDLFLETGLAIFKTENLYLVFNFSSDKKKNHGWRHKHNDILGVELSIDQNDILKDPGSYVYTSDISKRNYFRSTEVHNVPLIKNIEQNRFLKDRTGVFNMIRDSKTELLEFSEKRISALLQTQGKTFKRVVEINKEGVLVTDFCSHKFVQNFNNSKYFSPGYGKLVKNSNQNF